MAQTSGKPTIPGKSGVGAQVFTVNLKTKTGAAYDLTGKTVTVSGSVDSVYRLASLACTVAADPTTGTVTFTPSAEEIPNAENIDCMCRIDNGGAIAFSDEFTLELTAPKYSAGA